jgi:aminoglycoside phosphotransferase (APT) family kinase protein
MALTSVPEVASVSTNEVAAWRRSQETAKVMATLEGESAHSPTDVVPVRSGQELDWPKVAEFLRLRLSDLQGPLVVRQFPNGSANLTYLLRFGTSSLVLRRPPFGRLAPGAHDMRREYRTLSRLGDVYPAAPRALLFCDDHSVGGADFFVMEYREGVVVWGTVPSSMAHQPRVGQRVGTAVVDALVDLHNVKPESCGLSDLGRPAGYLERQVDGWYRRWQLVAPKKGAGEIEHGHQLLARSIPGPQRTVILHNDFKLDNCQFRPDDPDRVHSVFDWDMATLGDPLADLGVLLNYWPDPSDSEHNRGIYAEALENLGLPNHRQILDRYEERTGLDLSGIHWYQAFAAWKTAIVLQQLYDRYLRGETSDQRMATRSERVGDLARRAIALLSGGQA